MEHKNKHWVDGATSVFESEGLGSRIYTRLMEVTRVSPWTPGAGGPSSILRFGMDRFAFADSIQRRWAAGSPAAYDRASFQHVVFFGAIQKKNVARENSATPIVSVRVSGPERSPSGKGESAVRMGRIEKHGELAIDHPGTTPVDPTAPRLQASPAAPVAPATSAFSAGVMGPSHPTEGVGYSTQANETESYALPSVIPTAVTTPFPDVLQSNNDSRVMRKSPSSVTGPNHPAEGAAGSSTQANETKSHALPSVISTAATTPFPDVLQSNNDSRVMLKSPSTDGAAWGPIIRQRSRGQTQQKRESAADALSSASAGLKSSETQVPGTQAPAAQRDSSRSSLHGSAHSAKIGPASPDSVPVPRAKVLPTPSFGGGIVSGYSGTPVPVLQRAATVIRPSQESGITSHVKETGGSSTAPSQSSHLSSPPPIEPVSRGGTDGNSSRAILPKENQIEIASGMRSLLENADHAVAAAQGQPSANATALQSRLRNGSPLSADSSALGRAVPPSPALLGGPPDSGTARSSQQMASPTSRFLEVHPPCAARVGDFSTGILHRYQNSAAGRSMDVQSTLRRSQPSRDGSTIQRPPIGSAAAGMESGRQGASDLVVVQPAFTRRDFASHFDNTQLLREASGRFSGEGDAGSGQDFGVTTATAPQKRDAETRASLTPGLSPSAHSFAHDSIHWPNVGGRLQRRAAHGDGRSLTNDLTDWSHSTSVATMGRTLALTHRASPALNSSPILPSSVRPGVFSPEFSGRLQRAATDAAGEAGTTAAARSMSLPEQSGAWSRTPGTPDVASLANRVYDLLVRRLASERQSRGL